MTLKFKVGNNTVMFKDVKLKDDPLTLFTWEDEEHGERRRKRDTDNGTEEEEFSSKVAFSKTQLKSVCMVLLQHCDKTAAVDANGTKIVLCLNRSFPSHPRSRERFLG